MNIDPAFTLLVFQEHDGWVVQCLEYDIVAQGETIEVATRRWVQTLVGQIVVDVERGVAPLDGIDKAPQKLWELLTKSRPLEQAIPVVIPKNIDPTFKPVTRHARIYEYA